MCIYIFFWQINKLKLKQKKVFMLSTYTWACNYTGIRWLYFRRPPFTLLITQVGDVMTRRLGQPGLVLRVLPG